MDNTVGKKQEVSSSPKKVKLFKNGSSQAVRLPMELRFEGDEVYAKRVGNGVLLLPFDDPWQVMWESLSKFSGDIFPNGREQPKQQERPELDELFQ